MKIAVFGEFRSGKSALCECITQIFNNCELIEFGTPVQEVVDIIFPEQKGIKNRKLLVKIGQHLRKIDEDIWVNVIRHKIKKSSADIVLVCGVRQENEYEALKELGFTFIKVQASVDNRIKRCLKNGDNFDMDSLNDPTEIIMKNFDYDYLIENDGSFKKLELQIINTFLDMDLTEEDKHLRETALNYYDDTLVKGEKHEI